MSKDFKIEIKFNHFPQLAEKAHKAVSEIVRKAALDVEGQAKTVVPIDTGALHNSIDVKMEGDLTAIIGPHTDYAVYVEFGAPKINHRAQPYMTPAAEAVRPAYVQALTQLESRLR